MADTIGDTIKISSIDVIEKIKNVTVSKPSKEEYITDIAKTLYAYQTFESSDGTEYNATKIAQKCIKRARIFYDALPEEYQEAVTKTE